MAGHLWADLDKAGARVEARRIAEELVTGKRDRVSLWTESPIREVMHRHGLSRSAAYRLLEKVQAPREGRGFAPLDDLARDAITVEVAIQRARPMMIQRLVGGKFAEGLAPKSPVAAERWLGRHWKPEREHLRREPTVPVDARDPAKLEAAILALEAQFPGDGAPRGVPPNLPPSP